MKKNKDVVSEKLHSYTELKGEWKEAVDEALIKFEGSEKEKLFKWYYIEKRPIVPMCMELYISRRTLFSWLNDITNEVMLQASYRKLIKP